MLKLIFYLEVMINVVTVVVCFFFPADFIKQLTGANSEYLMLEMVRWYGVLLLVLTAILFLALRSDSFEPLRIVLLTYAIGDWIQLIFTWKMAETLQQWTISLMFTAVLSLLLFGARVLTLRRPQLVGF